MIHHGLLISLVNIQHAAAVTAHTSNNLLLALSVHGALGGLRPAGGQVVVVGHGQDVIALGVVVLHGVTGQHAAVGVGGVGMEIGLVLAKAVPVNLGIGAGDGIELLVLSQSFTVGGKRLHGHGTARHDRSQQQRCDLAVSH